MGGGRGSEIGGSYFRGILKQEVHFEGSAKILIHFEQILEHEGPTHCMWSERRIPVRDVWAMP